MKRSSLKRYILPAFVLVVFEIVAITLWLTKNNIFYLFNFSYIGISITLGLVLFAQNYKHARRVVQLLVGLYMLIYLGLICNENIQFFAFYDPVFYTEGSQAPLLSNTHSHTIRVRKSAVRKSLLRHSGLSQLQKHQ